jgi:nucleotide-binding universal stress UspA family protein
VTVRRPVRLVIAVAVTALVVVGCARGGELAVERAADRARALAAEVRDRVSAVLAEPDAPVDTGRLLDRVRARLPVSEEVLVLGGDVTGEGIALRLALTARAADDGGFGGVTEEAVRLCVRLTGKRGETARLGDLACDDGEIRSVAPTAPAIPVTVSLTG